MINAAPNQERTHMAPHQQRVVDEHAELRIKLDKLTVFMPTPVFLGLPSDEQERLRDQHHHMACYLDVLARRIAAFPA